MRQRGLAKTVGMPTSGYVIWTWGGRLVDGTSIRMPMSGVYRMDGTPMENIGQKPDYVVPPALLAGHVSVGACLACVEQATPVLRVELATFPVQLPTALQTDNAPRFKRWDRCRCKKCEWSGHEGQLGRLRTLMNDGDYPGKCPSCGAERRFLGPDPFEKLEGFDVVEGRAA